MAALIVGSLRRDDGWAWEQQEEVVHTNARLPSNFIHPLSLGGNWKPTLVSSYRNVMFFLFRNVVLLTFARFIATVFFILQRNSFFGFHLSKKYKQNLVNRLSNSSAHVGGLLPQKTSVPCARVRNDRNWREKTRFFTQSTHCSCLLSRSKPLSYCKFPSHWWPNGKANSYPSTGAAAHEVGSAGRGWERSLEQKDQLGHWISTIVLGNKHR